jgi:hypothetical protein
MAASAPRRNRLEFVAIELARTIVERSGRRVLAVRELLELLARDHRMRRSHVVRCLGAGVIRSKNERSIEGTVRGERDLHDLRTWLLAPAPKENRDACN